MRSGDFLSTEHSIHSLLEQPEDALFRPRLEVAIEKLSPLTGGLHDASDVADSIEVVEGAEAMAYALQREESVEKRHGGEGVSVVEGTSSKLEHSPQVAPRVV